MVYASRGNRVIMVPEYDTDKYLNQGYDITDAAGNILQAAVPTDINALKMSYNQHVQEIKALKAQIGSLNGRIVELEKALDAAKTKKSAEKVSVNTEEKVEKKLAVESAADQTNAEEIAKAEQALNRPRKTRTQKTSTNTAD